MREYGNRMTIKDCSNSKIFIPVILFFDHRVVKKGYYENSGLGLASDHIGVC